MDDSQPPVEFMATTSKMSLESYELSRLNVAANLRRDLYDVVERWIEAEVEARLARWVLEHRRRDSQSYADEFEILDVSKSAVLKSLPAAHHSRRLKAKAGASGGARNHAGVSLHPLALRVVRFDSHSGSGASHPLPHGTQISESSSV